MTNELVISWEDFHKKSRDLGLQLKSLRNDWEGVICVTRGGMVAACLIAQELPVKNIQTICIQSYAHQDQAKEPTFHHIPDIPDDGKGWLVIDELSDTGNTFKNIRTKFSKAHYACVYTKPNGVDQADTFIETVSQDTWIYFPWELEAQKFMKYL